MTEEPVLLRTRFGPIAGIITLPDDDPVAAMLIVQGSGGTRGGVNQVWARLARAALDSGVATMRTDYAGMSESWDADPHQRSAAIRDVASWTCDRTGNAPLLLVALCFGLAPAVSVSRERPVAGTALLIPPIFPARALDRPRALQPTARDRVRGAITRVRALPRRAAYRARYGPASSVWWTEQAEPGHPVKDLMELVSRTPTLLLMGSKDKCTEPVRTLLPTLQERGDVELDVVDDLGLRGAPTPEAQAVVCERLAGWIARSVTQVEAPT